MPHIIVKVWPGHTEEQKRQFADASEFADVQGVATDSGTFEGAADVVKPFERQTFTYRL